MGLLRQHRFALSETLGLRLLHLLDYFEFILLKELHAVFQLHDPQLSLLDGLIGGPNTASYQLFYLILLLLELDLQKFDLILEPTIFCYEFGHICEILGDTCQDRLIGHSSRGGA